MKSRLARLAAASAFVALVASPARMHAGQNPQADHDHDHAAAAANAPATPGMPPGHHMEMMAHMKASQQKLDALVKKMNDAKGAEKTDAIAALLTAMVQDHRDMHESMMSHMSGMMNGMKK